MKSIDLTKLIEGVIVVLLFALAIGKYDAIQAFARREAAASLRGWDSHVFFPREYRRLMQGPKKSGTDRRASTRSHGAAPSDPFHLKTTHSGE